LTGRHWARFDVFSDSAYFFRRNCILDRSRFEIWEGEQMSEASETMMNLLKELALLKELDGKSQTEPKSETEVREFEVRQNRREEITNQIKELGETAG
jgi:tagatose-1,6-bisphosphate aldolase non-catalytic subunit AgaZ/GatZ